MPGTVAILSFISVVVLATVTFIFITNTRKRIVEIKQDIKNNSSMMRNNLTKIANDVHHNDELLNNKYDAHTHADDTSGPELPNVPAATAEHEHDELAAKGHSH
tara:strand:- start:305 stop:616 length:312 start_codon:yes stop_codon:yes gene_type:complete